MLILMLNNSTWTLIREPPYPIEMSLIPSQFGEICVFELKTADFCQYAVSASNVLAAIDRVTRAVDEQKEEGACARLADVRKLTAYAGKPLPVWNAGSRRFASSTAFVKRMVSFESAYAERRPPRYRITVSKNGTDGFWVELSTTGETKQTILRCDG